MDIYERYVIGLDIGQVKDYTAVVVLGRKYRVPQREAHEVIINDRPVRSFHDRYQAIFDLRHCERIPLGTTYTKVIDRLRIILQTPDLYSKSALIIDATGCGRPVFEQFIKAKICKPIIGIQITGGQKVSEDVPGRFYNVPKIDLVSALQTLIQAERLRIASGIEHAEILKNEILNFQVKVNEKTGTTKLEAWREKDHDDLVLALAMAAWWGVRTENQRFRNYDPNLADMDMKRNKIDPLGYSMKK